MSQLLVDEEKLESLAYERSKLWSVFLQRCEQNDDGEEIELDAIDQLYAGEDEESIVDGDEAEEEDVKEDISNVSACMSKSELTLMLCSGDNKDIVNQTLPIVEEHVRKWKEAGLDRILNTFDAQKIEQHVGDWMRRHNSAYGDKTLLDMASPKKRPKQHTEYTECTSSGSETESMHSVDTARYIRASRKRTVSSMSSKCSSSRSPMTTIKMYRTLPKIRDELRAKYNCDEEQEHRHHMQALLHRRDRRKRELELMCYNSSRHYPYAKAIGSSSAQPSRRKQLRKRRDNSPMYNSSNSCSSSSEDECTPSRCNCSACVRRTFSKTTLHPYCAYRSYHSRTHIRSNRHRRHHHHQHVEMDTRSTHSMMHFKHKVCKLQRQNAFEEDLRARVPETDCNCCNKERLCSKVLHIANSSTEEWLVENISSPDEVLQLDPAPSTSRAKIVMPKQQILKEASDEEEDEAEEELQTTSQKQLTEKTKALVTFSTIAKPAGKVQFKSILKASPAKVTARVESKEKSELPKATALEVKKTPVESKTTKKETFAKPNPPKSVKKQPAKIEQKARNTKDKSSEKTVDNKKQTTTKRDKSDCDNNNKKLTFEKEKDEKQANDEQDKEDEDEEEEDDEDEQLKLALALSKKTYYAEQRKLNRRAAAKKPSKDSPQQLPEQSTIFNNQSVACNSTALANNTAKDKQIKNKNSLPANSSSAAVVIDLCSPIVKTSFNVSDGETDCTVVTSTTGCEVAPAPATASVSDPAHVTTAATPSEISESDTPIQRPKLTNRGILIYAPDKDQSGSLQSFSSDSSAGNFTLTEEALNPIIGQRRALKFLKYNLGHRSFDSRYPVYYRPPQKLAALLRSNSKSLDFETSSSSDEDIFDIAERYGEVYTVREKGDKSD